jgi:hypothetical protein
MRFRSSADRDEVITVMHPDTAIILAQQSGRRCPCGAATEHPYGLCAKCRARAAWKRHKAPARRTTRRTARRLTRRLGRLLPPRRTPRRPAIARTSDRAE